MVVIFLNKNNIYYINSFLLDKYSINILFILYPSWVSGWPVWGSNGQQYAEWSGNNDCDYYNPKRNWCKYWQIVKKALDLLGLKCSFKARKILKTRLPLNKIKQFLRNKIFFFICCNLKLSFHQNFNCYFIY